MAAPLRISYVVGRLDRAISQQLERAVSAHGLTLTQYTALSVLRRRTGLSNAQLARRTYVRPQSMIQVITTLERDGLIERAPDANHGRILRTKLTPEGRAVLARCDRAVTKVESAMLADLSADQREALLAALLSCVQHLGAGLADV